MTDRSSHRKAHSRNGSIDFLTYIGSVWYTLHTVRCPHTSREKPYTRLEGSLQRPPSQSSSLCYPRREGEDEPQRGHRDQNPCWTFLTVEPDPLCPSQTIQEQDSVIAQKDQFLPKKAFSNFCTWILLPTVRYTPSVVIPERTKPRASAEVSCW